MLWLFELYLTLAGTALVIGAIVSHLPTRPGKLPNTSFRPQAVILVALWVLGFIICNLPGSK